MIGHRPTNAQSMLSVAAAAILAPAQSFARIETYAKYLIGSTALVTTLLGGFGIFTASTLFTRHPEVIYPTLILFGFSLGLAIYAMMPLAGNVNIDNLDDVRHFLGLRLRLRSLAVGLAGLLFGFGLFSIAPAIACANRSEGYVLTASAMRTAANASTVKVVLKSPPDAKTRLTVTGKGEKTSSLVLFESTDPQVTETISAGSLTSFTITLTKSDRTPPDSYSLSLPSS
jgi:hypothetical protein